MQIIYKSYDIKIQNPLNIPILIGLFEEMEEINYEWIFPLVNLWHTSLVHRLSNQQRTPVNVNAMPIGKQQRNYPFLKTVLFIQALG